MSTSTTDLPPAPASRAAATARAGGWAWAALAVAAAGLAGSLFLSLGLGLKACPLCFYQRTFMMAAAADLAMGMLSGLASGGRLGLLALPLAAAGLGVAAYHVSLELAGSLECPPGLLRLGTAPQQSLGMFVLLFALLAVDVLLGWPQDPFAGALLGGAVVLGGLLALGSCTSNPPMPAAPSQAYPAPPTSAGRPSTRSEQVSRSSCSQPCSAQRLPRRNTLPSPSERPRSCCWPCSGVGKRGDRSSATGKAG